MYILVDGNKLCNSSGDYKHFTRSMTEVPVNQHESKFSDIRKNIITMENKKKITKQCYHKWQNPHCSTEWLISRINLLRHKSHFCIILSQALTLPNI